ADAHQREQVAAGLHLGGGVLDQQPQVGLQQPRGVLGPLHVATDPEHRLRDPAQHDAALPEPVEGPAPVGPVASPSTGSRSERPCCCCSSWARWAPWRIADGLISTLGRRARGGGMGGRGASRSSGSTGSSSTGGRWVGGLSTQVSLLPPPWLELTTSSPSGR